MTSPLLNNHAPEVKCFRATSSRTSNATAKQTRPLTTLLRAATVVMMLAVSPLASALDSDRNQPAVINADDVELDFKDGTRTYTGNVTVVQGSMQLTCDKLVARFQNNKLAIATAYGSKSRLATFKQRPEGKPYDVIGRAEQLELDQIEQLVRLRNTASLQQGTDSIAGGLILYNMATDKMSVKGRSETQIKQQNSAAPAPAPAPASATCTAGAAAGQAAGSATTACSSAGGRTANGRNTATSAPARAGTRTRASGPTHTTGERSRNFRDPGQRRANSNRSATQVPARQLAQAPDARATS